MQPVLLSTNKYCSTVKMAAPLNKTRAFINYGRFTYRGPMNFYGQGSSDKPSISFNRLPDCSHLPVRNLPSAVYGGFVAKQGLCPSTCKVMGLPMQEKGLSLHRRVSRSLTNVTGQLTSHFIGRFAHSKRHFSTSPLSDEDLRKEVDSLSEQFVETRELLEDARISFGSVYFNEDLMDAQKSLSNTLEQYSKLLERLSDSQRNQVARTIGLKMEELKAQQNMIMETIRED